jgi:hypothetical protein
MEHQFKRMGQFRKPLVTRSLQDITKYSSCSKNPNQAHTFNALSNNQTIQNMVYILPKKSQKKKKLR